MRQFHGRQDVQAKDVLVLRPRHLVELVLGVAAGVIDQHVHATKFFAGNAHDALEARVVGEVGGHDHRPSAGGPELDGQRLDLGGGTADQDQVVARLTHGASDVLPDSPRRSSDQSRLHFSDLPQ